MYAVIADRIHRNGWVNVRRVENGIEEIVRKEPTNRRPVSGIETQKPKPLALSDIEADDEPRINMHDDELNRVLGGGLIQGSLVLIGGEPGIGKSTLVMQTVLHMPEKKILYLCAYQEYESRFSDYRLYTDYFHRKYRIVSRKYSASQRVFGVYSSFCERNTYACIADRTY